MYGTISDEIDSRKREPKCKSLLQKFDDCFPFTNIIGSGDSYLYHIKNAASHGHIIIRDTVITITNRTPKKIVYKGKISLCDLTKGFIKINNELMQMIVCDKSEFINAFNVIDCICSNKRLEKVHTASHIPSFHLMASYESNFESLYAIIKSKGASRGLMENIFTTDCEISIPKVRKGLSHRAEIMNGKLCIYEKDGS